MARGKPWCCFIDEDDSQCDADAEWRILPENDNPYDYSEACTEHVGELLVTDIHSEPTDQFVVIYMGDEPYNDE